MKHVASLTILATTLLLAACGDDAVNTSSESVESVAPVVETASTADDLSWSSLNETQKVVLSVGEKVWPTIPVEKRREMMLIAGRWSQTDGADQYKMINELRDYAGLPHISPAAKK